VTNIFSLMAVLTFSPLCLAAIGPTMTAEPIWPAGREKEMNLFVGFRAVIEPTDNGQPVTLRLTAANLFRVYINGRFCCHGPARGPHGYWRVDEWDISEFMQPGPNVVAIEVAAYNVDSYYLLNQPGFLQAEVVQGKSVLAATGHNVRPFEAKILTERIQKVQRYSFQRPFTEAYRLTPDHARWHQDPTAPFEAIQCAKQPAKLLLPRGVPYPKFEMRQPISHLAVGALKPDTNANDKNRIKNFLAMGIKRGGYPVEQFEVTPARQLMQTTTEKMEPLNSPWTNDTAFSLKTNSFHTLDLGVNLTGFLGAHVTCKRKTHFLLTFDEVLTDGDVDFTRMACANVVSYELEPGTYHLETFEPYTLRYIKAIALDGECTVNRVYLREYANPDVYGAKFKASDERLNRLFLAGRETFRQNALDIFMDCPSRERAGWLCDSFFTSRAALDFMGNTAIERNFYENYLLPATFPKQPDGMLPMCYPAEHRVNSFLPNWALWFVVELEEYLQRSGDRTMVDALKPRIMKLFDYFRPFENDDGLLEKLKGWVFVEWSAANKFVQDVNYPTNMLYAAAIDAAGRLYAMPELQNKADAIRETIRQQSFDGEFFVDNAERKEGKLQTTRNRTETCQYYAFFFNVAAPETHPVLWKTLVEQFGPKRKGTKAFPEIHESNAFIGNVLRLELLSRDGRSQQVLDESVDFHLYMADRTGTLWENVHAGASCNHGFASHLVHVLYRDVLGISHHDPIGKKITLRFSDLDVDWCEGTIPILNGKIKMRWRKDGDRILYRITTPPGYNVSAGNRSSKEVVREQ